MVGLSCRSRRIPLSPRLNVSAIFASESPSLTVYLNGADGVNVAVSVGVGVSVKVAVGDGVIVGVNVRVGVGVSVAKIALRGLLGPVNQMTSMMIPAKTRSPATP